MSSEVGEPTLLIGEPEACRVSENREREGELRPGVAATATAEECNPRLGSFLGSGSCGGVEFRRGFRTSRGDGGGVSS